MLLVLRARQRQDKKKPESLSNKHIFWPHMVIDISAAFSSLTFQRELY